MLLSLLRGINVAGQKKVPMVELKKLYESLGYKNVRTYIQSGNVLFDCDEKDEGKIAAEIERAIEKKFGFKVKVLIRTKEELQAVIDKNPFHGKEAGALYVSFLEKEAMRRRLRKLLHSNRARRTLRLWAEKFTFTCRMDTGEQNFQTI